MCFVIDRYSREQTAERDILCGKSLSYNSRPCIYSNYKPYRIGKLVYAEDTNKDGKIFRLKKFRIRTSVNLLGKRYKIIDPGIHSYRKQKTKDTPFIIPKGTRFYVNKYELVSLKIKRIAKKDIKKYKEY